MAGKSDGSIVIDTTLDNSGFEKGSKELLQAIRDLTKAVNEMARTVMDTFTKLPDLLQNTVSKTATLGQTSREAETAIESLGETAETASQATGAAMEEAVQEVQDAVDITSEASSQATNQAQQSVQELGNAAETAADQTAGALNEAGESALNMGDSAVAAGSEVSEALGQAGQAIHIAGDAASTAGDLLSTAMGEASQAAAAAATEIESDLANAWDLVNGGSDKATQAVTDLESKIQSMAAQQAPTDFWLDLERDIAKCEQQLQTYAAQEERLHYLGQDNAGNAQWTRLQQLIAGTTEKLNDLRATQSILQETGQASRDAFSPEQLAGYNSQLDAMKSKLRGLRVKEAAAAFGQMVKSKIQNGLKSMASSLAKLGKNASGTSGGLKQGLKSLLLYGVGIRSVFALVNRLRRYLMEGLGNLAQYSPSFNGVMSQFIASLKQLQNAFAAAFAPVLEVVLPILTTLVNALTDAINRIGAFIGALTGKATMMKATKVQYDYAKAQSNTASNASEASDALNDETKAAKEAMKQLAGFDDVEVLSENKNSSAAGVGGSGGGGANGAGGFDEIPIANSMANLADLVKKAWEKADFTGIGRIVGTKLKNALDNIPWDSIKASLRKIAHCTATFLNGFLETPGLFESVGHTIAESLNSAFAFLEEFVTTFHWGSLGKAISGCLSAAMEDIEWNPIYNTFEGLGKGIGDAINKGLEDPKLAENLGRTAGKTVNSLFKFFNGFVSTTDWSLLGQSIIITIQNFFATIDWGAVGNGASNVFIALWDFLSGAILQVDWESLPSDICTTIGEFLAGFDWSSFCESLGTLLGAQLKAVLGIGSGLWRLMKDIGKDIISGGWEGIKEKISTAATWIKDNIFTPFINGFKKAFGIASPAKEMKPLGKFVTEGFLEGIKGSWSTITGWLRTGAQWISDKWKGLKSWFTGSGKKTADDVKSGISGNWSTVTGEMQRSASKTVSAWKGQSSQYKSMGKLTAENIKTGLASTQSKITGQLTSAVNSLKSTWAGKSSTYQSMGKLVADKVKSGISGNQTQVLSTVKSIAGKVQSSWSGYSWFTSGQNLIIGLWNGIADRHSWVYSSIMRMCKNLWESVKDYFRIGSPSKLMEETIGRWIPAGIAEGIDETAHTAVESVTDLGKEMVDEAAGIEPIVTASTQLDAATDGIDRVLTTFSDKIINGFDSLIDRLDAVVSGYGIPAVAAGSVTPYGLSGSNSTAYSAGANQSGQTGGVSQEEFSSAVNALLDAVKGISFYIGDQDLARHVNRGNDRLGRRFKVMD